MSIRRLGRNAAAMAVLGFCHQLATAQVVVTYGPDVASVPTLTQWGMAVMTALLAAIAVIAIRKGAGSKTLLSIAAAALVSSGAPDGSFALPAAWANGYPSFYMSSAGGGQVTVTAGAGLAYVRNDTSVRLRIISVTPVEAQNADAPACAPGVVVAPGHFCYVNRVAPA